MGPCYHPPKLQRSFVKEFCCASRHCFWAYIPVPMCLACVNKFLVCLHFRMTFIMMNFIKLSSMVRNQTNVYLHFSSLNLHQLLLDTGYHFFSKYVDIFFVEFHGEISIQLCFSFFLGVAGWGWGVNWYLIIFYNIITKIYLKYIGTFYYSRR